MKTFKELLAADIRKTIRLLKSDHVCGMGIENLKQVVRLSRETMEAGPKGTNCQYVFAETFSEVCMNDPFIRKFAY
jgi:hypothetical protein